MPRRDLTFVRLPMPTVGRRQLRDAMRLQLTQYMPAGPFGFVCRPQSGGAVVAWAWPLDTAAQSPHRGGGWAESTLDAPGQGLRLVKRSGGFEAQQWLDGELLHCRWFEQIPDLADWQRFVRGCGADPRDHPLGDPIVPPILARPARAWLAGDNLPASDPWQGWRWQAAVLLAGSVAAAALGLHLQARQQLQIDSQRLQALRSEREASLQARRRYEQVSTELESLRALAPQLSQLELLDRVAASGIFAPVSLPGNPTQAAVKASPAAPGTPALPPAVAPAFTRLLNWDYRSGQLKMTLELPERDVTLLDIVRRLEGVAGLSGLRVGQDGTGNVMSVSAQVDVPATAASASASAARSSSGGSR